MDMFGSHRTPIYQYTTYHTYIRQKYSPPRTNFEETNYMVFGTYGWMDGVAYEVRRLVHVAYMYVGAVREILFVRSLVVL